MFRTSQREGFAFRPVRPAFAFSILGLLSSIPALADIPTRSLDPVFVTATRFSTDSDLVPIGATVVRADQIREAGINNVSEAVRKLGGVYGRQNLSGTPDYELDLRGFGTNSSQNLVVMVDGIRLSENELTPAVLSSVPIESVERIEILRGGASVLYGEGATGGVINVITRNGRSSGIRGTVIAEIGNFRQRSLRGSAAQSWDDLTLDANVGLERTNGYRDNGGVRQKNFSGGAEWRSDAGRFGVRLEAARQDARLPGSLTFEQFQADPRQSTSPNDFGSIDTDRISFFAERRIGTVEIAAELSHRDRTSKALFDSNFGAFETRADTKATQFSPRIRHVSTGNGLHNTVIAGVDLAYWSRNTDSTFGSFPSSAAEASQRSQAAYLRNELRLDKVRLAAGVRREWFNKDFTDPLASPSFGATADYEKKHRLNAWELQASYAFTPAVEVFAKAGRSYRVANVDENGFTPVPDQPLDPQTSRDLEAGIGIGSDGRAVRVRLFQHRIRNEIFYNPLLLANANLDPTRRRGIEVEGNARLGQTLAVTATWQHLSASFTGGDNAGREVVLVPRNIASLRLNWQPTSSHTAHAGVHWVDSQRYGGDFDNACTARIPSFATLDARYAWRTGGWELAVAGANLADRDYFTNAFGACRTGIYPDPGRQLKVSARYDF